jgi:APA family basic amino acid/polyamine antiporter
MTAPRVYYAMARDGLFFGAAAAVHPRFGTPARAIAIQAMLACVLIGFGTFRQIIAYFIFITVIFIGLTVAAVFMLRRRNSESGYLAPGYPVTPMIFLTLVVILLVLLAGNNPTEALLGTFVVALGLPVYQFVVGRGHANVE